MNVRKYHIMKYFQVLIRLTKVDDGWEVKQPEFKNYSGSWSCLSAVIVGQFAWKVPTILSITHHTF